MIAWEKEARALIARAAEELGYFNAHGDECDARFTQDCDICEQTDEADEHCTCLLALRRDLEAFAARPSPTTGEK
jgi:hypothetical protein